MIEIDLYNYLKDQEAITDIVSDKILPNHLTESSTFPVLTVQFAGSQRTDTLIHPSGILDHVYQIDSYSHNFDESIELAEAVRQCLQGFMGTMGDTEILYVQLIAEENSSEAPIDGSDVWIYRRFQKYKIKHRESVLGSAPQPGSLIQLGTDGKSAYEIAVDNGFVGNEAAWLLSLKGDDGAEGTEGQSAYDIAVAGGFVGDQSAWLASLVGATGSQGIQGETGATGATGATGSFSGSSSDSLAEGSTNLYYTTARAALKQDAPIRSLCTSDFTWSTTLTDQTWSPLTIPSTGTWYLKMVLLNKIVVNTLIQTRYETSAGLVLVGVTGDPCGLGQSNAGLVTQSMTTGSPTIINGPKRSNNETANILTANFVVKVSTIGTLRMCVSIGNTVTDTLTVMAGSFIEARKLS